MCVCVRVCVCVSEWPHLVIASRTLFTMASEHLASEATIGLGSVLGYNTHLGKTVITAVFVCVCVCIYVCIYVCVCSKGALTFHY